jgi:hypothetical protein
LPGLNRHFSTLQGLTGELPPKKYGNAGVSAVSLFLFSSHREKERCQKYECDDEPEIREHVQQGFPALVVKS